MSTNAPRDVAADRMVATDDAANARLRGLVSPPDWQNPQPRARYNLVVIGGGTAGLVTAQIAAGLGAHVALVERAALGGDCLNVGCVPSKSLLHAAKLAHTVQQATRIKNRAAAAGPSRDFADIMQRLRDVRADIAINDAVGKLVGNGIDVFFGNAGFVDDRTIAVGEARLSFRQAVIATGSRAFVPEIPGLTQIPFLTNESVFNLTRLPQRLAVIGGGPIGVELAQAFQRLGSEVTLFQRSSQLLPRDDADAAEIVQTSLAGDGVMIHRQSQVQQLTPSAGGITIMSSSPTGTVSLEVDEVLLATGRQPNVSGLQLEAAGVAYDEKQGIHVDDRGRTTNRRIYAAGDVCSAMKFTHAADAMARLVVRNALFFGRQKLSHLQIPWCTYTSPEVAQIGLTEAVARKQGVRYDVYQQDFAEVDRAILTEGTAGFAKVLTKAGSGHILGATIVGAHAGELIAQVALAMHTGRSLGDFSQVIHPYPTRSESLRKLGDRYQRTRLTKFRKNLLTRFLAWRR